MGIIAISKEELLLLIIVQRNQSSLITMELKFKMLLLMRSFWKAVKIKKTSNVPGFNDFRKEVPGVKVSESTVT